MIPFIQSDLLKQLANINHGFTTRQGGVSTGCFDSLNVAKSKGDLAAHVIENLRRIAVTFQVSPEDVITLRQTHTNKVEIVDENWTSTTSREADALVTKTPGKLLGILTADCVPVLLADPHNHVVAAVHAGWRGALRGIIQNTLTAMVSCGADPSLIQAAIGPCIWQSSYEVDQHFYNSLPQAADLFIPSTKINHWLFDLPGFVKRALELEKITTISSSMYDTYKHPEMFFSCRRTTHLNEESFGCSLC